MREGAEKTMAESPRTFETLVADLRSTRARLEKGGGSERIEKQHKQG